MWVMGGYDDSSSEWAPFFNVVWKSTDGATWTQVTASANWGIREAFKALVFDNGGGATLWVLGGYDWGVEGPDDPDGFLNDVWHFNLAQ